MRKLRAVAWLGWLACLATLAGCGGGSTVESTVVGVPVPAAAVVARRVEDVSSNEAPGIRVAGLRRMAERRVSRTVWRYDYRVDVVNDGPEAVDVVLTATSLRPGTRIVDGAVVAGDLPAGASASPADTITIEIERAVSFAPSSLVWQARRGGVTVDVALDPSVPAPTAAAVTLFVSPFDERVPGQRLRIPLPGDGRPTLLMALDAQGRMRAAALTRSAAPRLDADTTASALAGTLLMGLAVGPRPWYPVDEIRAATGYATLVSAVTQAMDAARPVGEDRAVAEAALAVATQVFESRFAAHGGGAGGGRTGARLGTPVESLPHMLYSAGFPYPHGVALVSLEGGSIGVRNTTPVAWTMRAELAADGRLTGNSPVVVSGTDLLGALGNLSDPGSVDAVSMSVPGRDYFNLRMQQDAASRIQTTKEIVGIVLAEIVGRWQPAACATDWLRAVLAEELARTMAKSSTTLETLFSSVFLADPLQLVLSRCNLVRPERISTKLFAAVGGLVRFASGVSTVYTGALVSMRLAFAAATWDVQRVYGVCRGDDGRLVACPAKLVLQPPRLHVAVGTRVALGNVGSVPMTLAAEDRQGRPTPLPPGLRWSLPDDSGYLEPPDPATGATRAKRPGVEILQVTDPATGLWATMLVDVVEPRITPQPAVVEPGGAITLSLTTSSGQRVEVPSGSQWSVADTRIGSLSGGPSGTPSQATFTGLSRGRTEVVFTNGFDGSALSAFVEVGDPAPEPGDLIKVLSPGSGSNLGYPIAARWHSLYLTCKTRQECMRGTTLHTTATQYQYPAGQETIEGPYSGQSDMATHYESGPFPDGPFKGAVGRYQIASGSETVFLYYNYSWIDPIWVLENRLTPGYSGQAIDVVIRDASGAEILSAGLDTRVSSRRSCSEFPGWDDPAHIGFLCMESFLAR